MGHSATLPFLPQTHTCIHRFRQYTSQWIKQIICHSRLCSREREHDDIIRLLRWNERTGLSKHKTPLPAITLTDTR